MKWKKATEGMRFEKGALIMRPDNGVYSHIVVPKDHLYVPLEEIIAEIEPYDTPAVKATTARTTKKAVVTKELTLEECF